MNENEITSSSIKQLIEHLREHASRIAGGGPSESNYDPETLGLEQEAAYTLERVWEAYRALQEVKD